MRGAESGSPVWDQLGPVVISTRIYVVGWIACLSALAALVVIFPGDAGDVVVAYSLAILAAAGLMAASANYRLLEYLKLHHREQWARLVFFPNMPWNCPNSIAITQFLFTREHLSGDPILESLRKEGRRRSLFLYGIAFHLPVVWMLSVVLLPQKPS